MVGYRLHETFVNYAVEIGPQFQQQDDKTTQQGRWDEAAAQHLYFTTEYVSGQYGQGNDENLN